MGEGDEEVGKKAKIRSAKSKVETRGIHWQYAISNLQAGIEKGEKIKEKGRKLQAVSRRSEVESRTMVD